MEEGSEPWHGTLKGYDKYGCREECCKSARRAYLQSDEQKARRTARDRSARASYRAWLDEIKNRPCADCGLEYPSVVMDFDHRDPKAKRFNISDATYRPRAIVLLEIEKCDIVCANCHRLRTQKQWREGAQ